MKKSIFFVILALVSVFSLNGVHGEETKSVGGRFIGGVGLGGGVPIVGFGSAYSGGGGVDEKIHFFCNLGACERFFFERCSWRGNQVGWRPLYWRRWIGRGCSNSRFWQRLQRWRGR